MRLTRYLLAALVIAGLIYLVLRSQAPSPTEAQPRFLKRDFRALGTPVSIRIYRDPDYPYDKAEQALVDCERFLQDFERRWAPWGKGDLGRLNAELAAGRIVSVSEPLQALFALAAKQTQISRGLFDPRIGGLVKLWGFDDHAHLRKSPPAEEDVLRLVKALKSAPAYVPGQAYGPAPDIQWDFGAIAMGAAVEQAVARLKRAGISNAYINAGGNLKATGTHGDRPWRIDIRPPRAQSPKQVLASLEPRGDEAVMTRSDDQRYFEFQGHRYHHILNPSTGHPAQGFQSVTVVYPDAALAASASAALFIAGPEYWYDLSILLNISEILMVDANGKVTVTRALAQRLEFAPDVKVRVVQ